MSDPTCAKNAQVRFATGKRDLVERLRDELTGAGEDRVLMREAADELERLRRAGFGGLHYSTAEKLLAEVERLRGELKGKISQSYAAELARQVGELETENERLRVLVERLEEERPARW